MAAIATTAHSGTITLVSMQIVCRLKMESYQPPRQAHMQAKKIKNKKASWPFSFSSFHVRILQHFPVR